MAKKFEKIENHIGKPPKIIEKTPKNRKPRGQREAPPPWGAAEGGAFCFFEGGISRKHMGMCAKHPPPWGAAEGGALLFSIFGWIFVADALFMLLIFHWATGLFA